jgi:hypothetical protein
MNGLGLSKMETDATNSSEPVALSTAASPSEPPAPPLAPAPTRLQQLPQLIGDEKTGDYDDLFASISGAVTPADVIEEIFVRDIVDLVWEILRLRRLKTQLLASTVPKALAELLKPYYNDADNLAWKWATREKTTVQQMDGLLAGIGLNMDAVLARALAIRLDEFERVDRIIMTMEVRRNAALREIDRHRETLGQQLRRLAQRAEDAEFEVIDADQVANAKAT